MTSQPPRTKWGSPAPSAQPTDEAKQIQDPTEPRIVDRAFWTVDGWWSNRRPRLLACAAGAGAWRAGLRAARSLSGRRSLEGKHITRRGRLSAVFNLVLPTVTTRHTHSTGVAPCLGSAALWDFWTRTGPRSGDSECGSRVYEKLRMRARMAPPRAPRQPHPLPFCEFSRCRAP